MIVFKNLILMEFQVKYLALFRLFSVIDSFEWFWKGSLYKDIQLILEFVKAPFLVLQFSYYTSTTFYDTALYLGVIRHLICGNK